MQRACDIIKVPRVGKIVFSSVFHSLNTNREMNINVCKLPNNELVTSKPIFGSNYGYSTSQRPCSEFKNAKHIVDIHTHPLSNNDIEFSDTDILNTVNSKKHSNNLVSCVAGTMVSSDKSEAFVRVRCAESNNLLNMFGNDKDFISALQQPSNVKWRNKYINDYIHSQDSFSCKRTYKISDIEKYLNQRF